MGLSGMREPRPLQPWQRPPFERGNGLAVTHGAYSPRRVDPLATDLFEKIVTDLDYLADPSYRPALWAWARAEARVQLLSEWLDEHGPLAEDGTPRPALAALYQFERLAAEARSRLGLDPLSRSRLGLATAQTFDLARHWQDATQGAETAQDGSESEAGE